MLSGHTAAISHIQFSPSGHLATCSWDNSARLWDIFGKQGCLETLDHNSEIVACEFNPHNEDFVTTTLQGQVFVWDPETGNLKGIIDGKDDIAGGRLRDDRNTSKTSTKNKHFNTIAISPNGEFILAAGNAKNICLYDIRHRVMLRRFAIT